MSILTDLKDPNRHYGIAGFNSAEDFKRDREIRRAVPKFDTEHQVNVDKMIRTPEQYRLEGFNQAVKVIDLFASRHFGPTHVFRTLLQVLVKTTEL